MTAEITTTIPVSFRWDRPEYLSILQARIERLQRLRAAPALVPAMLSYYRDHVSQFVSDWGMVYEPRHPEIGLPATVPFVLFPRQRDLIDFFVDRWRAQEGGIVEKSRDVGASWLAMSFSCAMCLLNPGLTIGVGSRKEELVDRSSDPSSLFFKARMFLQNLPPEFRGGWEVHKRFGCRRSW